jgi:hypothetical protein
MAVLTGDTADIVAVQKAFDAFRGKQAQSRSP